MSPLQLRKAEIVDAIEINKLSDSLAYSPASNEVATKRLQSLLQSESDEIWLCLKADKIVGWMHIFLARRLASATFVEIGGMVVNASDRQQGIGKFLLNQAKDWAAVNNCKLRVRSNSVRDDACKFYLSMGFKEVKNQNVYELD